jgi:hypothetical protein
MKIKAKIKDFLSNAWDELDYGLKRLCGQPSPMHRFVAVLVIGGALAVANLYFVVSSIYKTGKQEAEKQFMEWHHIKTPELGSKQDSINILNHKKYE